LSLLVARLVLSLRLRRRIAFLGRLSRAAVSLLRLTITAGFVPRRRRFARRLLLLHCRRSTCLVSRALGRLLRLLPWWLRWLPLSRTTALRLLAARTRRLLLWLRSGLFFARLLSWLLARLLAAWLTVWLLTARSLSLRTVLWLAIGLLPIASVALLSGGLVALSALRVPPLCPLRLGPFRALSRLPRRLIAALARRLRLLSALLCCRALVACWILLTLLSSLLLRRVSAGT
jgi:hypothetical protein